MELRERVSVEHYVDPVKCPRCGTRGAIADSRNLTGYRRRRHECPCGHRWTTYQSVVNPRSLEANEFEEQLYDYVGDLDVVPSFMRRQRSLEQVRSEFYQTAAWKTTRRALMDRCHHRCEHCGIEDARLRAHHIDPFATHVERRGELSNLVALCCECHAFVHSRANIHRLFLPPSDTQRRLCVDTSSAVSGVDSR